MKKAQLPWPTLITLFTVVKQEPAPATLEQAVDNATAIDDPIDNVAQCMINIGQTWATAPSS
jgi:hypothetical protein